MAPDETGIEEVDLCTLALLGELAELDAGTLSGEARVEVLRSAQEAATQLQALGGGSLGEDKVNAILSALNAELADD